ncbi:MAG: hypothetical protein L3J68_00195 [Thermoplasmata archaeon]|nr:hypothetical protein [Thermoplasmata archaeon]
MTDTGSFGGGTADLVYFIVGLIVSVIIFILAGGGEYLRTRWAERTGDVLRTTVLSKHLNVHPQSRVHFQLRVDNLGRQTRTVGVGYGDPPRTRKKDPSAIYYGDLLGPAEILLHPSNQPVTTFPLSGRDQQELEVSLLPKREGTTEILIFIYLDSFNGRQYNLGPFPIEVSNKFRL